VAHTGHQRNLRFGSATEGEAFEKKLEAHLDELTDNEMYHLKLLVLNAKRLSIKANGIALTKKALALIKYKLKRYAFRTYKVSLNFRRKFRS
jgi:hypothetical protein